MTAATHYPYPASAPEALSVYQEHGELAMLFQILSDPALTPAQEEEWNQHRIRRFPDGTSIAHLRDGYLCRTPAEQSVPTVIHPAQAPRIERLVPVAIASDTHARLAVFPELPLYYTAHGLVSVSDAMRLSHTENPLDVLGVDLPHYEGPGILRPEQALDYLDSISDAFESGVAPYPPRQPAELDVRAHASLLYLCELALDLDWDIQPGCLGKEVLYTSLLHVGRVLRLPGSPAPSAHCNADPDGAGEGESDAD